MSPADANNSGVGTNCGTDYLEIPNGQSATNAAITTTGTLGATNVNALTLANRFCGRLFNYLINTINSTVCSKFLVRLCNIFSHDYHTYKFHFR